MIKTKKVHCAKVYYAVILILIIILTGIPWPIRVSARMGECGYDGGISSKQASYANQRRLTYNYREVCFITGEPIVFEGILTIEKSLKNDQLTTRYRYALNNTEKSATLDRNLEFRTTLSKKENGQTIEETVLARMPQETISIGDVTYTANEYEFTRTNIIDPKPAVNYYSGNVRSSKVYEIGGAAGTVKVETTGSFYGYEQYWGCTETQVLNVVIECENMVGGKIDKWGGTANIKLSSSDIKQLKYEENELYLISFQGGFILSEYSSSILEYVSRLPEFDKNGVSTDNIITTQKSLKLESFPSEARLPVPDIRHLRGHWAEKDVKLLYSLDLFNGNSLMFEPEQLITRAEFTAAMVQAAKEVPADPALASKTSSNRTTRTQRNSKNTKVEPSFKDVLTDNIYFASIEDAYKRGLIAGKSNGMFYPGHSITVAEAVTIFIRALGLESLSPGTYAVTSFRDDNMIPNFAREAVYVAQKIGLVRGDDKGYLRPNESLTKARAAAMINRFLEYMRDGMRKDYRDGIVNY